MNYNYRGDTFDKVVKVKYQNSQYTFQEGDVIKAIFIKSNTKQRYLPKQITIEDSETSIMLSWTSEEMKKIPVGECILEIEVVTPVFTKTYQESKNFKEDYI